MAKETLVIDSSVVVKWFIEEKGSDIALRFRDEFAKGNLRLSVPSLVFYEVINALKVSRIFDEKDLVTAARSMSSYDFEVWLPRGKVLEESARLSSRKGVTVYDACYVALAVRRKTKLLTEDDELLQKFPNVAISLHAQGRS